MQQGEKAKSLDLKLWNLLGGAQYHTQQQLKIKYKQLLIQKNADELAWLNRKSKLKDEI